MVTHLLAAVLTSGLAMGATAPADHSAVDRAAREFRLHAYEAFRTDRDQYDRCLAAWSRVETAWVECGQPESEREQIVHWLTLATEQVAPGASQTVFPEAPAFVAGAELKHQLDAWWVEVAGEESVRTVAAGAVAVAKPLLKKPEKKAEVAVEKKPGLPLPFSLPIDLGPVVKQEPTAGSESGASDTSPASSLLPGVSLPGVSMPAATTSAGSEATDASGNSANLLQKLLGAPADNTAAKPDIAK